MVVTSRSPRTRRDNATGWPGVLLGAGASVEAGFPHAAALTSTFRRLATNALALFRVLPAGNDGHVPPDVCDELEELLADARLGYEDVLGHLQTQFLRDSARPGQPYHTLYSRLVELVSLLLNETQIRGHAGVEARLPDYKGLVRLAKRGVPLWVFSLNHDLLVEGVADMADLPLFTGFRDDGASLPVTIANGSTHRVRYATRTEADIEKSGLHYCNRREPALNLFKLHGSLDEFAFRDGKDLLKLIPAEPGLAARVRDLRLLNDVGRQPFKVTNEITYADDAGEVQFLRRTLLASAYKYDGRNRHVLPQKLVDHFRAVLNYVGTLHVVGYSFRDTHVNAVLRAWLELTAQRTMVIVGPSAGEIPVGFGHLTPQIEARAETALQFFKSL